MVTRLSSAICADWSGDNSATDRGVIIESKVAPHARQGELQSVFGDTNELIRATKKRPRFAPRAELT